MKIDFLKLLDKYIGFIICVLISFINIFLPNKRADISKLEKSSIHNILVMKFWGLGSILLLTPTIRELKNQYNNSKITVLTLRRNRSICESLGLFDEIITLNVDRGWFVFTKDFIKLLFLFLRTRFNIVIDFEFFTRFSSIVTFLTFAKIKIGYHSWETWRGNIHNIEVPFNRYWHMYDNFYNLGVHIGFPAKTDFHMEEPTISANDMQFVDTLLNSSGSDSDYMCIHVNASDLSVERRWPYDNFIKLINKMIPESKTKIIFIGTKPEEPLVLEIINKISSDQLINLIGKVSIPQLAYLFKKAKVVVSNDSGPLHLAVAMNTPTISFFGPETPVLYGPKEPIHKVFFKSLDCSPCINVHDRKSVRCYFDRPKCMDAISVEEVYGELKNILTDENHTSS